MKLLALVVAALSLAAAPTISPTPETALAAEASAAPGETLLRLVNRDIIVFRVSLGAATPEERAAAAIRRFDIAVASGSDTVTTRPQGDGVLLLAGEQPLFVVTPGDAQVEAGGDLYEVAKDAAAQAGMAITERREGRNLRSILIASGFSLLATLLTAALLWLLTRLRQKTLGWLGKVSPGSVPRIGVGALTLIRPERIIDTLRYLVTGAVGTTGLAAAYLYLTFVLTRFPYTRPWGEALGHYLVSTISTLLLGAIRAVPSLIVVAVIFIGARLGSRLLGVIFHAAEAGTIVIPGIHPETARPTKKIFAALIWMFAVVVAYPYLPGSDSTAFKGVSVFGGLLLTLGSAGIVGQAMSGLVLMYARGFKVGDYIKVGEITGVVLEMGMLSTRVRTYKNEVVTLPNGVIVGGAVTNYSFAQREGRALILYSSVTIGYDVPWRQVHDLLIAAAKKVEGCGEDPAPFVLQRGLDDWYVEYQVNIAVDPAQADQIPALYSRLHQSIQDGFWEAGVEILSPSYFAVRDGNTAAIPEAQRPKRRGAAFRVDVNPT